MRESQSQHRGRIQAADPPSMNVFCVSALGLAQNGKINHSFVTAFVQPQAVITVLRGYRYELR